MVMDVFLFRRHATLLHPRERTRKRGMTKRMEGRSKNEEAPSVRKKEREGGGGEGEKVEQNEEEARGDGLTGANHLVCIHLRRILFLRSLCARASLFFLENSTSETSRDSSWRKRTERERKREKKK